MMTKEAILKKYPTVYDFLKAGIKAEQAKTEGKRKGIHAVWSKFNEAVKAYYELDPKEELQKLQAAGKVVIRPAKGGVMVYLAGEQPKTGVFESLVG